MKWRETPKNATKQKNFTIFFIVFALEHVIYCKQEPWQHGFFLLLLLWHGTWGRKNPFWKQCMQWVYGWLSVNHIDKNILLVDVFFIFFFVMWFSGITQCNGNQKTKNIAQIFLLTLYCWGDIPNYYLKFTPKW